MIQENQRKTNKQPKSPNHSEIDEIDTLEGENQLKDSIVILVPSRQTVLTNQVEVVDSRSTPSSFLASAENFLNEYINDSSQLYIEEEVFGDDDGF